MIFVVHQKHIRVIADYRGAQIAITVSSSHEVQESALLVICWRSHEIRLRRTYFEHFIVHWCAWTTFDVKTIIHWGLRDTRPSMEGHKTSLFGERCKWTLLVDWILRILSLWIILLIGLSRMHLIAVPPLMHLDIYVLNPVYLYRVVKVIRVSVTSPSKTLIRGISRPPSIYVDPVLFP